MESTGSFSGKLEIRCTFHEVFSPDCEICRVLRNLERKLLNLHDTRRQIIEVLGAYLKTKQMTIVSFK